MKSKVPLCGRALDEPVAVYCGREISVAELFGCAYHAAKGLPEGVRLVNICSNRFHFLVYFLAAMLQGGRSVFPSNKLNNTVSSLLQGGASVVSDSPLDFVQKQNQINVQEINIREVGNFDGNIAFVEEEYVAAEVYTSGSTGAPSRLYKKWSTLYSTALKLGERFDSEVGNQALLVLATVPCQHMYGLETSVVMPLFSNLVAAEGTPFYPSDILGERKKSERPCRLITTPVHMRSLDGADLQGNASFSQLISATAPLDVNLARSIERKLDLEVCEIFGFSEAGSIATRITTKEEQWRLLCGYHLESWQDGAALYCRKDEPPHVFPDNIEVLNDSSFRFMSRANDTINVGGKRMSLNELLLKLLALDDVEDAYLYIPDGSDRPAGFVVCKGEIRQVLEQLFYSVDPVFLPRPLKKIDKILRNPTGKVTAVERVQMESFVDRAKDTDDVIRVHWTIDPAYECFSGHFPGNPLLPGAFVLCWIDVQLRENIGRSVKKIRSVKFLRPVTPELKLLLIAKIDGDRVAFNLVGESQEDISYVKGKAILQEGADE